MPSTRITSVERATPWMMLVSVRYAGANCSRSRAATDAGLWWSRSRIGWLLLVVGSLGVTPLECPYSRNGDMGKEKPACSAGLQGRDLAEGVGFEPTVGGKPDS